MNNSARKRWGQILTCAPSNKNTSKAHIKICPRSSARIDGLGKMIQMLGRYYVQYFNYNYQRTGTLWEGRYKSSLISSEQYLFTCMRYIVYGFKCFSRFKIGRQGVTISVFQSGNISQHRLKQQMRVSF